MNSLNQRKEAARWFRQNIIQLPNGNDLSFALFGSFCTGQLGEESDIDLLIVGDTLPLRPFDRSQWLFPLIQRWKNEIPFPTLPQTLSPLILTVQGWNDSIGLQLSLSENSWILQDDGTLSSMTMAAQQARLTGDWKKIPLNKGGWVWTPKGMTG